MIQIAPFEPQHLYELDLQEAQSVFSEKFNPAYARALQESGHAYTGLADGRPVVCAGFVEQWEGRALAWALVSGSAGPHFVHISKAIRRMLAIAPWRRIEAQVDCEFAQGIRWAELLGFHVESKMEAFTPEGRDAFMYVRLKNDRN